jgi:hypothetical protein
VKQDAVIVLVEALEQRSFSAIRSLETTIELAQILGLDVYPICRQDPTQLQPCLPQLAQLRVGIWLGDTALPDRYDRLYEIALDHQIQLVNTPAHHALLQDFDQVYALLSDLMPKTLIITQHDQWESAAAGLGFPIVIRVIRQRSGMGEWAIANDLQALQQFHLMLQPQPSLLFQHLQPRHTRCDPTGFPLGRQYQVVFYQQTPLTYGYRWAGDDPLIFLDTDEEAAMMEIAIEAATRLQVPLVAIEVVQQESGEWLIVGVGDLYWSNLGQMPLIQLWNALSKISPT